MDKQEPSHPDGGENPQRATPPPPNAPLAGNPPADAPPADGEPAPPAAPAGALHRAIATYDKLFPRESPRRKYGPLIVASPVLALLLLGKCAVSSVSDSLAAASQAREETIFRETTGVLLVTSNRPEARIEARLLSANGEAAASGPQGTAGRPLSGLAPGRYAITAHTDNFPDAHGESEVTAGQSTAIAINFPTGGLRLASTPTGATVKHAGAALGKTPLVIPQLPPGDVQLTLTYANWPALPFTVTITADQETAASARLPHGRLAIDSIPAGATVVLDGRTYKPTPLSIDPLPPGPKKLTLQTGDFPPLEVTATVVDGEETRLRPVLASAFPLLNPADLLRDVWLVDDRKDGVKVFNSRTGIYRPKNDVVKNLHRQGLHERWLQKSFRFGGPVRAYNAATGVIEFERQKGDLSAHRVLAQLRPGTDASAAHAKGARVAVHGRLTAVEEAAWPGRVITLELSEAEILPEDTP